MAARTRPGRSKQKAPRRAVPAVTEAERRLLELARTLPADGSDAVQLIASAYRPDAPLPRALVDAWIASRRDKTRALALAWAREQLRLALEAALRGAATVADPATLAWLVIAGCEALAHELPSAVADRLAALVQLVRPVPTTSARRAPIAGDRFDVRQAD